jgi:hypothetical protein
MDSLGLITFKLHLLIMEFWQIQLDRGVWLLFSIFIFIIIYFFLTLFHLFLLLVGFLSCYAALVNGRVQIKNQLLNRTEYAGFLTSSRMFWISLKPRAAKQDTIFLSVLRGCRILEDPHRRVKSYISHKSTKVKQRWTHILWIGPVSTPTWDRLTDWEQKVALFFAEVKNFLSMNFCAPRKKLHLLSTFIRL